VYRFKFAKAGYEVTVKSDGQEILDAMTSVNPAVVVLDLVMPRLNGFETLTKLRQDPQWHDLPIVVISNSDRQADRERSCQLGATDFVIKSNASIDEIVNKIGAYAV
jgi:CheY-like chemotaxis protein